MLVLIDGDIVRYRCAFAAEKNYYLGELINPDGHKEFKEFFTKKEAKQFGERVTTGNTASYRIWNRKDVQPLENCLNIVKTSIQQIIQDVASKFNVEPKVSIILSGPTNFREGVAKTAPYKGNREEVQKPTYYKHVGEYLMGKWNALLTNGHEADDELGIRGMEAKEMGKEYIIVSNDKDLDQITGLHYDWITKEFYEVSSKQARLAFYIQLLSGDATDNIPGLPGIGKVKAQKALAECKSPTECLEKCIKMYEEYKLIDWQRYLVEQADLVYILKQPGVKWSATEEGKEFCIKYLSPSSS